MSVHLFDWRDLPKLHRFRNQSIFLDSSLVLTRGPLLLPGALLSYLAPSMGVFTGVGQVEQDDHRAMIGQVIHQAGAQLAHLTFLAPDAALDSPAFLELLDYLVFITRERGAFRLLADVDERSPAFETLHQAGFAAYTRQRIWQFTSRLDGETRRSDWRVAKSQDALAIRSLYNNLVPGLVQQAEPFSAQNPQGLVYQRGDELLAYVELKYGHRGIWAQPFIHPDALEATEQLGDLLQLLPHRDARPVYICVRSYQSWLEPALEELGAEAGPRQAVMVRHLAAAQKALRAYAPPVLEGGHPEITAPIVRSEEALSYELPANEVTHTEA